MTKGIADALNLPRLEDAFPPFEQSEPEKVETKVTTTVEEDLEAELTFSETRDHGQAMDLIHRETLQHSRTLMDLGYNTDPKSRRGILEIASAMYRNSIDAKNSKRDGQLKLMKLLQDRRKLDMEEARLRHEMGEGPSEQGVLRDRNDLVKRLREKKSD